MAKELQSPGSFLTLMLEKYNLNPFKLSKDIHLSQSMVRLLCIGKNKITVPVAMRLAQYFNTNPEFWLAMQMKWDIAEVNRDKALMKIVKSIPRVSKNAASSGGKQTTTGKTAAKKPAAQKKTAKKAVAQKRSVAAKKPAVRKPTAQKRKIAPKKPVSQKKTVTARKKPVSRKKAVALQKKPARASGRGRAQGRSAKKR